MQQFDPVTMTGQKNEYISRQRVVFQVITNQSAQPVKSFAHVACSAVQKVPEPVAERNDHDPARFFRNEASTG
jgi:hypothetical protein